MPEASIAHPDKPILEYDQITNNIYIGTNQCCQMHFEQELLDKGVTADISVEGERLDSPEGVDYFVWLPTKDHTPPTMEQIKIGVANLKEMIDLGIKVYVHCMRGHGRAPTLVSAYFISQGKDVEAAIEAIRAKRPSIHLEESQVQMLAEYRQELIG